MSAKKSSSSKGLPAILAGALAGASLAGCVDYTKRSDTVTLAAGNAQAWNKTIHTADPWPPYVMNTQIPGDGQRTAGVIQRYSTRSAGAASATRPAAAGEAAEAPGTANGAAQ